MLDFQQLVAAQKAGDSLMTTLSEDEKFIMVAYCDAATEELITMGLQHHATSKDLVRMGILEGVTLGLKIAINNGHVEKRVG